MNNEALVSIIIPMFNAEKYIEQTLESIFEQSYTNWEVIIVDNFSTDRSREIVTKYINEKIQVILLNTNSGGPAKPRNIGIDNAKGKYIAFLDADDIWMPTKLEKQLVFMQSNNYNFSSTNALYIDAYTTDIDFRYNLQNKIFHKIPLKPNICDVIKYNFIIMSSVLIERKFIVKFYEDKKYASVEDFCMWMNLLNNYNIKYGYFKEKKIKYRILDDSTSDRKEPFKQVAKGHLCIINFILENNKYEYMNCFYSLVRKISLLFFIKKIVRR